MCSFSFLAQESSAIQGETQVRKLIVAVSLILFIAGTVLAAYSVRESRIEVNIFDRWDHVEPLTLDPQNLGPRWALKMPDGSFFELNISASNALRLRIGTLVYNEDNGEDLLTNLIFDQIGTRFVQEIAAGGNNTYQVEIKNEGISLVNVWGSVLAKKTSIIYSTAYPYASLGAFAVVTGSASMIYGILSKPKRRRGKRS